MNPLAGVVVAALFWAGCAPTTGASGGAGPRELVHAYPPSGPVEVVGTVPGNRVLRQMQRYSMPAFTDLLALHVAHTLKRASEEPVAIRRTPRGQGIEAAIAVSSAAPDGRTLLLASRAPVIPAAMQSWRSVGSIALRPAALVATMPYVLVTQASAPLELRLLAARRNDAGMRLLLASAGERTASHDALRSLSRRYRSAVEPVAYNGGSAALQAVAVQETAAALVPLPAALPYLAGARLRVLIIADARRHPLIPTVRTAAEAGLPEFEVSGWFGLFVPRATPRQAIAAIEALLAGAAEAADAQEAFSIYGLTLEYAPAEVFAERLALVPGSD